MVSPAADGETERQESVVDGVLPPASSRDGESRVCLEVVIGPKMATVGNSASPCVESLREEKAGPGAVTSGGSAGRSERREEQDGGSAVRPDGASGMSASLPVTPEVGSKSGEAGFPGGGESSAGGRGGAVAGEGSSLPLGQDSSRWGECAMGPPPVGSPAMEFIRKLEGEGSRVECRGVPLMEVVAPINPQLGTMPRVEEVQSGTGDGLGVGAGGACAEVGQVVQREGEAVGQAQQNVQVGGRPVLSASQEKGLMTALRGGRSFASVAGSRVPLAGIYEKFGRQGFQVGGGNNQWDRGMGGPEHKRRNVVQLRFQGGGVCPSRGAVVDMVLDLGVKVAEIFAIIHPANSNEFDISFTTAVIMEAFLSRLELVKGQEGWKSFRICALSRQEEVKEVTILVRNESLPPQDITTWISRYGQLQSPMRKSLDAKGIWTGAWLVRVKLNRAGNSMSHIPASAFIGRDRILAFYQGQPRLCFKCGSPTHFSADCTVQRCVKCGGFGHLAEGCSQIRCNLCGELGHPFSRCPKAFRGYTTTVLNRENEGGREDNKEKGVDVEGQDGGGQGLGQGSGQGESSKVGSGKKKEEKGKKGGGAGQQRGQKGGGEVAGEGVEPPLVSLVPMGVGGGGDGSIDPGGGEEMVVEVVGGAQKRTREAQLDAPGAGAEGGSDHEKGWEVAKHRKKRRARPRPCPGRPGAGVELSAGRYGFLTSSSESDMEEEEGGG